MAGLRSIPKIPKLGPKSKATVIPVAPVANKTAGRPLVDLEMPVKAPQGPELYRFGRARTQASPVGAKPEDFPGTQPEWVWYVVSWWYHNEKGSPRNGNYIGSPLGKWLFQAPENPDAPRAPGGSVSDFVYVLPAATHLIVRIEGYYWHIGMGAEVQARDAYLTQHAGASGDRVVRINDGDFMGDPTGATAIKLLADALAGRPRVGALQGGIVESPRYAEWL